MKYVVKDKKGRYLTPRRATDKVYVSRSGWEHGIENARVFNNHTAALNSARQNGARDFKVQSVEIVEVNHDE